VVVSKTSLQPGGCTNGVVNARRDVTVAATGATVESAMAGKQNDETKS